MLCVPGRASSRAARRGTPLPMPRNSIPKHIAGKSPASARATSAEPRTTRTRHAHAATRAERVARETDEEAPALDAPRPTREHRAELALGEPALPDQVAAERGPAVHCGAGERAGERTCVDEGGGQGSRGDRRAKTHAARVPRWGTLGRRERASDAGGERREGRAPVPDTKHVTRNASAYSSHRRSMAREGSREKPPGAPPRRPHCRQRPDIARRRLFARARAERF